MALRDGQMTAKTSTNPFISKWQTLLNKERRTAIQRLRLDVKNKVKMKR